MIDLLKRTIVHLPPEGHREDIEDLMAFKEREKEPLISFEEILKSLKKV